jgi:hypothetical protein
MKFTLTIDLDNEAFDASIDGNVSAIDTLELAGILRELSNRLHLEGALSRGQTGAVQSSGEVIGNWTVEI